MNQQVFDTEDTLEGLVYFLDIGVNSANWLL